MYTMKLTTLKWLSFVPEEQNGEGIIRVIADAATPNITNLLPAGTKFFLNATNGIGEDPTILRTCTAVFFDTSNNQNVFNFTPAPAITWTSTAYVVIQLYSQPSVYSGYFMTSATGVPTVEQLNACINNSLANS